MRFRILIIVIIIFAFSLRFWQIDKIPPSLNWDEISLGYNAYSVLQTGKDEWGVPWPVSFRAYGDYKLPAYVYLDVPFIATFDLNEWGVRLPSVVLGVGFTLLILLILKKLTNLHVASWGIFLSAIIPWTIIISRIALEATLALFLTTLGFYLFLVGLEKKGILLFSAVSFGLTIFSYNSSRVVTPLLLILLGLYYFKELKKYKKQATLAASIFLVFFALALPNAFLQDSSARYRWTKILDEGAINRIEELRRTSDMSETLARINYNKITYFVSEASKNYASHFSPDFLFLNGGSNYQFSIPGSGLLYPILVPFLLLGFWQIYHERKKWQLFSLAWLLIAPIPAAITRDSPHALRSLMMIPPLIFTCSVGLDVLIKFFKTKYAIFIKAILIAIFIVSLLNFLANYSNDYVKNYSWSWQYGYKQIAEYIKENESEYDTIYITKKYGEPHEFVLFYLQYDPTKYMTDPKLVRYEKSDWFWVDNFDKYHFVNDWEIRENVQCTIHNVKCLLVTNPGNYPEGSQLLETINFLDGKGAFDIVELPQVQ